jgi:hypothetical protein
MKIHALNRCYRDNEKYTHGKVSQNKEKKFHFVLWSFIEDIKFCTHNKFALWEYRASAFKNSWGEENQLVNSGNCKIHSMLGNSLWALKRNRYGEGGSGHIIEDNWIVSFKALTGLENILSMLPMYSVINNGNPYCPSLLLLNVNY